MAATDKLSDKAIRAALKAAVTSGKPSRLSDGGGLHLQTRPNGSGSWRLRFWKDGKEGMLSLGTYPDVSLASARDRRVEFRREAAAGTHPGEKRKAERAVHAARQEAERMAAEGLPVPDTFEHTARDWYARQLPAWSPGHAKKILALLVNDLFPLIGTRQLAGLTAPEVLKTVRRIEERGAVETAYRALKAAGMVFRHGAL